MFTCVWGSHIWRQEYIMDETKGDLAMTANILPPTGGKVASKSFSLLIIESYSLGITSLRYPSVLAALPFRVLGLSTMGYAKYLASIYQCCLDSYYGTRYGKYHKVVAQMTNMLIFHMQLCLQSSKHLETFMSRHSTKKC